MQIVSLRQETICMKCKSLFPGKKKKTIINLLSAEFAKTVKLKHSHTKQVFYLLFPQQSLRDNFHEISNSVFWKQKYEILEKKIFQNITIWSFHPLY